MFAVEYCCAAFPEQPEIQILDKLFLRSDIECESLWLLAHYKIFLLFYPKPYSQFEQMDLLKRKWTQFFYGSLTNVECLRLGHFLRNYKG